MAQRLNASEITSIIERQISGAGPAAGGGEEEPEHAASDAATNKTTNPLTTDLIISSALLQCWRLAASLPNLPEDAILHPVTVPPFHRVYRRPLQQDREVEVVTTGEPGCAGTAEFVSLAYRVPRFDVHG